MSKSTVLSKTVLRDIIGIILFFMLAIAKDSPDSPFGYFWVIGGPPNLSLGSLEVGGQFPTSHPGMDILSGFTRCAACKPGPGMNFYVYPTCGTPTKLAIVRSPLNLERTPTMQVY